MSPSSLIIIISMIVNSIIIIWPQRARL